MEQVLHFISKRTLYFILDWKELTFIRLPFSPHQ
jgi:hypothetical protein